TGTDTDARFSGRARVAFLCVSRALFVTTQYVTQAIPILPHRVIERHYRAAGDAEHDFDILAHECFAHHLCARARRGMGDAGLGGGVGHALTPPTVGRERSRGEHVSASSAAALESLARLAPFRAGGR